MTPYELTLKEQKQNSKSNISKKIHFATSNRQLINHFPQATTFYKISFIIFRFSAFNRVAVSGFVSVSARFFSVF